MELFIKAVQLLGGIILLAGMAWFVYASNQVLEDKEKQDAEKDL